VSIGPLPLLILPVLAGVVAYLLRGWRSAPPLLAAGVSLALGLFLILVPAGRPLGIAGQEISLEEPVAILGRALVLAPSDQLAMGLLFVAGAGLFLLAWQFDRGGLFAPLGLGMLGLLGGVFLIRPLIYAALLLQIAAAFAVFPLHVEEGRTARGGLRFLTFYALALPGLMISHWLLDMYAVSPDQAQFLHTATVLIGFSFVLMLGLFPFYAWVPAVGLDGSPLMASFLYTITSGTVWFLLLDYLQIYPWLSQSDQWYRLLAAVGTTTALVGGAFGMTRRGPGALMGYAVMVDTGMAVVALGQGTRLGIGLLVWLLISRGVGAALMAAGLEALRRRGGGAAYPPDGLGRRVPWGTLAVLVGGLSLAGFPFTVGFAAHWALLRVVFSTDAATGLVLLLASAGPLVGLLRLMGGLLQKPRRVPPVEGVEEAEEEPLEPESPLSAVLILLFVLLTLGLGVFPQPLAAVAERLAGFFTFFGP